MKKEKKERIKQTERKKEKISKNKRKEKGNKK
jgi:hypothetical protein